MARYKFFIDAYYAKRNQYLEIDVIEKELFEIGDKTVKLISLDKEKKISESEGIRIECGIFYDITECIKIAKKVYTNFLIRLNNTDISYVLDKATMGNFIQYCKDDDAEIYKEIVIEDMDNKDNELYFIFENAGCGCTHFYFNKLIDVGLNHELKNSLMLNNYRKYLSSNNIQVRIDNTLFSASIEMLLNNKENRNENELEVIKEICDYLDKKFEDTDNEAYKSIKSMIQTNKHKSIGEKIRELVKKYCKEEQDEILDKIKEISRNRTKEIHVSSKGRVSSVSGIGILNKLQIEYAKKLYKEL